jgi:hypothetical protein
MEKPDRELKGEMSFLMNVRGLSVVMKEDRQSKHANLFAISNNGTRTLLCSAGSDSERRKWVQHISNVFEELKAGRLQPLLN